MLEALGKKEDAPSVSPMAGDLAVWRAASKKTEKLTQAERAPAQDRFGSVKGAPARLAVESAVILTLRGVQPTQEQGIGVHKDGERTSIDLYRGSVIVESVDTDLLLQTPEGRIEGKAACLLVDMTDGKTRLVVVDGTLTFTNDLGKVDVTSGHETTVAHGKTPSEPQACDAEKEVAWGQTCDVSANLFVNPGFEQGSRGWSFCSYNCSQVNAQIDTKVAHMGRQSARISFERQKTADCSVPLCCSDDTIFRDGAKYFMRAWYRREAFTCNGSDAASQIFICSKRVAGQKSHCYDAFSIPGSESKWTCARQLFTANADEREVCFVVSGADREWSGTVWWDDLYLAEVPEPPAQPAKK